MYAYAHMYMFVYVSLSYALVCVLQAHACRTASRPVDTQQPNWAYPWEEGSTPSLILFLTKVAMLIKVVLTKVWRSMEAEAVRRI